MIARHSKPSAAAELFKECEHLVVQLAGATDAEIIGSRETLDSSRGIR